MPISVTGIFASAVGIILPLRQQYSTEFIEVRLFIFPSITFRIYLQEI
jgi:hypothetical protein